MYTLYNRQRLYAIDSINDTMITMMVQRSTLYDMNTHHKAKAILSIACLLCHAIIT